MNIKLQIFFTIVCLLNCSNDHINKRKEGQSQERIKFENDFFANGPPAQISHKQLIHNARVTTDSKMAALHYRMTYLKNVEYRLRVFKKTQQKLTKLKRKMATEALKFIVRTMILTDLLAYVMLACKDQNGKILYGNGDLLESYVTIASWISLALILLAGDIETNPGPETEIQLEIHAGGYKMLQVDAFVDADLPEIVKVDPLLDREQNRAAIKQQFKTFYSTCLDLAKKNNLNTIVSLLCNLLRENNHIEGCLLSKILEL